MLHTYTHKKVLVLLIFLWPPGAQSSAIWERVNVMERTENSCFLFCASGLPSQCGEIFDGKKRDATSVPASLPTRGGRNAVGWAPEGDRDVKASSIVLQRVERKLVSHDRKSKCEALRK
ncbi:hypothetical protein B0J18DRAFT_120152 [Chaetomium sp. MPI-SDFR-AT-0129]|nr:hypothetical protein B0J18DRAFT_120152 [Chaetomium sp. MPI-SDFR-AT-0129]